MDEVIRRRNATHFDSSNVTSILLSSGMIFLSLFTPTVLFHT
jgi:nucleoporin POM34